jgi:uroporphyrinogen decarboxylase
MRFAQYVKNAERPLAAPLAGFPGAALARTTVKENLCNGEIQAKTLAALHKLVQFDIVFPMMDLTVEAQAFGAAIDWEIDALPAITGIKVETQAHADALIIPEVGKGNRLGVFVEACRLLKQSMPEKIVWAYVLGPFSIAGRLMGMTEIAVNVKLEPELVHTVLKKTNALLLKYADALLGTGVDGVMVLEPAAGMLGVDDANQFSNAYITDLVNLIKQKGKTPALHNCGHIMHLIESLCATGIEVLHVGSVTDPAQVYPRLPEGVVLMGNLDPTEIFLRAAPEHTRAAAEELALKMKECQRFIISSGCDLPPEVSIQNLAAFEEAVRGKQSCCSL